MRPIETGWERVDPPRRPVLLINPRSGGGKAARVGLADHARERGIEPIVLEAGDDPAKLIAVAVDKGADTLGMAGGDGSLAAVAATASERNLPFVCIPAGTRNHFARDLGIAPDDLVGALDAFGDALERTIDLGSVDDRPFLNNVSLGIYGDAVQQAGYRDAKLRTLLEIAEREALASSSASVGLRLVDDRAREHSSPALVLVSNNPYAVARPPARGARPALDSGQLGVIVIDRPAGAPHPLGRAWSARSLRVVADQPVPAGIDGEAVTLMPPLSITIHPRALRVRIAPRNVGELAAHPAGTWHD
jgi:diacylglycerol kinase family enzyme